MTEKELFEYLKDKYIYDLEMSKDEFCTFDCFSSRYNMVIELKSRRTHYNELMLERYKYDKLNIYRRAYYINSTPMGVFAFDVKKLNPVWLVSKMPRQTDFEKTDKINKEYCLLNINEAKRL